MTNLEHRLRAVNSYGRQLCKHLLYALELEGAISEEICNGLIAQMRTREDVVFVWNVIEKLDKR